MKPAFPVADNDLIASIVARMDDETLRVLAQRLAPFLAESLRRPGPRQPDEWLDTKQAARYLGLSVDALHKLTAARGVPFEQDGPGCKCWFSRADLDDWRRGRGRRGDR